MSGETEKNRLGKGHYAWVIMIACCVIYTMTVGMLLNTSGLFFQPVSRTLNVPLGRFTASFIISGLMGMFTLPLAPTLYEKFRLRNFFIVILTIICLCPFTLSFGTRLWQWYIINAIQGCLTPFILLSFIPYLINRWFEERKSFAIGVASMFSGLMGAAGNMFGGWLIATFSWRIAYRCLAITAWVVMMPAAALLKRDPSELGLHPYGAAMNENKTLVKEEYETKPVLYAGEKSIFAVFILMAICMAWISAYSQHMSSYGTTLGMSVMVASTMASTVMVGNLVGKLLMTYLNEKIGPRKASFVAFAFLIASMLLLCISSSRITLYAGAGLLGFGQSLLAIQLPLLVGTAFEKRRYSGIYSVISVAASITVAVGSALLGMLCDFFGSYIPSFFIGAAGMAICILGLSFVILRKKRLEQNS